MKLDLMDNIQVLIVFNELLCWVNGEMQIVNLELIMMKLLMELVVKRGEVCFNEELIDCVWVGNVGVGKLVLRKNIYKLRKLLSQFGEE